jgi:hypothetical protein
MSLTPRLALGLLAGVLVLTALWSAPAEARAGWCPVSITDGRTTVPLNLSPPGWTVDDVIDTLWNEATLRVLHCFYGSPPVPTLRVTVRWIHHESATSGGRALDGTCGPPPGGPNMNSRQRQVAVDWNGGFAAVAGRPTAEHLLRLAERDARVCPGGPTGEIFAGIACETWHVRLADDRSGRQWVGQWRRDPSQRHLTQALGYMAHWRAQDGGPGGSISRGVLPLDASLSFYSDVPEGRIVYRNDVLNRTDRQGHLRGTWELHHLDGRVEFGGRWEAQCQVPR